MTFGPQVDVQNSRVIVDRFLNAGYRELDTAYVYNEGKTERLLGVILKDFIGNHLVIGTKVNPRVSGKLDAKAVNTQLHESLKRLRRDSVDILYFHFPDPNTRVESALEECAKLHEEGKILELGLSNFPGWLVVHIWHLCKQHGWPKPTVYQGLYNGLSRNAESELFPALRELGMRFYAYNPLAGGILSGKYTSYQVEPAQGRFILRPNYRDRYWKESIFRALSPLIEQCRYFGITLPEAAYRWLAFHSHMDASEGDGILVGASKPEHLEVNLAALNKGKLPDLMVSAFSTAWEEVRSDSPNYFRYVFNK